MTFLEFDEYQEKLIVAVINMKYTKGIEYSNGEDRFSNFNEEAKDVGVDRLKVAEIFLNKHIRAIKSYIKNGQTLSNESIQGRIVDAITYLTLLGGMIYENENNPSLNQAKENVCDPMRPLPNEAGKNQSRRP